MVGSRASRVPIDRLSVCRSIPVPILAPHVGGLGEIEIRWRNTLSTMEARYEWMSTIRNSSHPPHPLDISNGHKVV